MIAGTERARVVYPADGGLAIASDDSGAGQTPSARLKAGGGTAIGSWLTLPASCSRRARPRCHAILLTDGENEHETAEELDAVLAEFEGRFQCDCRGVGTDWQVSELRRVASVLLGTVDIIADPADMAGDFRTMMETAMGKATDNVSLRVWTPQGARVAFVRQVAPAVQELTDRAVQIDALTADYPTGTWGASPGTITCASRCSRGDVGDEMLAGRVSLVEGDDMHARR